MRTKALHILSILLLTIGSASVSRAEIKILGNVYGGGDQAAVKGKTSVEINKGLYGGEIFGGGNGALHDGTDGIHAAGTVKSSADIGTLYDGTDGVHAEGTLVEGTGTTSVTINGGKFLVEQETTGVEAGKLLNNHNVFGGGNLACNVFGNTNVAINASLLPVKFFKVEGVGPESTSMYRRWGEYVGRLEGMATAHVPDTPEKLIQGSIFGAGYGAHTDVAGTTNINIALGEQENINSKDDILTRYSFAKRGGDTSGETLASKFVITAFGGGYDGTATNTNVQISGSPFLQNVFGGGLGSKAGAAQKDPAAVYTSTVGTITGGTNINITGATIYGNVYGGGAGIFGETSVNIPGRGEAKMPYYKAAMVMKETNVEISGGTLIFGNVYGGGDIANTGWFEEGYRPSESHQNYENESKAHLDLTTYLQMKGGNVMGNVFAGGNGRKITEIEKANFIGAIIGNTSVVLGNYNGSTWNAGTKIWGSVYGGGQNGCVYSCAAMASNNGGTARTLAPGLIDGCTNVEFKHADIGQDIFGGGLGAVEMVDHDHNPATPDQEIITSADISGNTFVYFNRGNLITEDYWDEQDCVFKKQICGIEAGINYRDTPSDIAHNLYGGGNVACTIGTTDRETGNLVQQTGNTTVYMIGAPVVEPAFVGSKYYLDAMEIYGKPHFSAFGAGYGKYAKVLGNAYSDIALVAAGFHSVVGGGMNGPVEGECITHIACNAQTTRIHNVYGGGYYAPVGGTKLYITEGHILENVFGGGVMGNIDPANADMTKAVATTVIGLKDDGKYTVLGTDGSSIIREYPYNTHKNKIIIDGNVYGGNDVSGTVNGVASLTLYGGTVKGNVHGAGNGNHVGYYVPDILKYDKGTHGSDNYFYVDHSAESGPKGDTYVGRPQTIGGVNLTLEGNTKEERVSVLGQVFGGGNSCTIGKWDKDLLAAKGDNPHLVRDDPAYFLGGGTLDINLGSHVTIGRTHEQLAADADGDIYIDNDENVSGLFMGCSGRELATQTGAYTVDNRYHHFFDYKTKQYYPGFAVGTEAGTPMTREQQLKPFQAYLNNIMVWSNNVRLNIPNDAEDIWLANFVGGGFRGSMRAMTSNGKFDYTLPEGVTVNHTIIGGAYNAHVQYHYFATDDDGNFIDNNGDGIYDYATTIPAGWAEGTDYVRLEYEDEENPDPAHIKSIIRYNFNGGILSENSTGVNSSDVGHHVHKVHADPREVGISDTERDARYSTAYFEPLNESDPNRENEATRSKLFSANKDKTLLHLTLKCALEPEVLPKNDGSGKNYAHGGNVFGGCFMSGFVEGDSWVDYHCWLAPKCAKSEDAKYKYFFDKTNNMHIYDDAGDLETNNALSVYGAGYGTDTHSNGDVYLYIKSIALDALGDADPAGMFPYIFNAFGGSNMGTVSGNTNVYYAVGQQGTLLGSLYGGGYKGVIEGNTFVEMAEGFAHNVYGGSRQADIHGASHVWAYDGKARGITNANHLIICNLYGGNDIAGTISGTMPAKFSESKWNESPTGSGTPRESLTDKTFNTYVEISADDDSADRGFPLVGSAFAGGNGEEWTAEAGANPDVQNALIEIAGGSTLRAFGGGNMATVTGETNIFTDAKSDNFANVQFSNYQKTIMTKVFFSGMKTGFKWDENRLMLNPFHVVRLFGGNNLATMDIQPTWNLKQGKIENVYSGGNMGDMTYYNPDGQPATTDGQIGSPAGVETLNADGSNSNYKPRGLSITIDQPDIYINSLFGGCRMSNVTPTPKGGQAAWPEGTDGEDFYGATVNITDGYIENVYGGNDVSGIVHHGTNVNISGAVSGNVYGSGNGFYLYKYDADNVTEVTEDIDDEYGIFYRVPELDPEGKLYDVKGNPGSDTHKLLTINAVRPSVEKAFLNIAGLEHYPVGLSNPKRVAYVKGNVFCGGNASTITGDESFSKFKIGSYVTLNGVFMGSDGKAFTDNDQIAQFAKINDFADMGKTNEFNTGYEVDFGHNPILLNTYMMAVDMKAQPKDFNLKLPLKEAHIGTYCGGGNRGSMLVDKTVTLPFHHDIIIYDKIVAACLDANVKYNQNGTIITSNGGYTRKIADNATYGNTKMRLDIASQFVPLVMDVPDNKNPETLNAHGENFETAKAHDFLYRNQTEGVKYTYQEFNDLFETVYESDKEFLANEGSDHVWKEAPGIYAPSCNIYGGCYQSGEVEGDIELNIHTNMLRYVNKEDLDKSIDHNIACFNVYGAGFGQDSHVWGNVTINMDRNLDTDLMGTSIANSTLSVELKNILKNNNTVEFNIEGGTLNNNYGTHANNTYDCSYPSANNIIGGGRNGKLIGNATVEIRNGLVYSDVAGGCYASDMYGSTHVIVGYPKYYKCLASGEYQVDRADKWNTTKKDGDGNDIIKQSIWYLKGDLVPDNIYQQITDGSKNTKFELVDIQPVNGKNTPTHTNKGIYDGTTWDDIVIKIGKGIYGGGYSLANSTAASAGSITTHKLLDDEATTKDIHPHNFFLRYGYDETTFAGYGGNSSIMLGDQDGGTHDHIRISTLNVAEATIPAESSVIGKFIRESDGRYTHQGDHTPEPGKTYYTLTGDGGIYGDGHLTFCEGFRTADVTRYGWADGTAKHPILMNTFQRMDLLSVNDCCLMLQGAQDFATDQIDATIYSITRINEMRLNSSLNANSTLGQISAHQGSGEGTAFDTAKQRNYLAFFNNVHYLGSIVTNDAFGDGFHNNQGELISDTTYYSKKLDFITKYAKSDPDAEGNKTAQATTRFKQRNVATARNAIGINNGYCLRIQNQEYEGTGTSKVSKTYYGPIVGVCEVKLLTLVQGEGGGYVYADNIHEHAGTPGGEDHFLMTSGNFVFPGIIEQGEDPITHEKIGDQYIVDDCFVQHFGSSGNITTRSDASKPHLDEAHYWYVEGNKYFFTTTLTGFTYKTKLDFDLIKTDPNVVLSGMQNGSKLNIKKIEWLSTETGFHRNNYEAVLPTTDKETDEGGNTIDKISDYEFDIQIGGNDITDWKYDMPRYTDLNPTTGKKIENDHLPQLNIRLQDKLDNSGDAAYINHLDEPELVKIYLVGETIDENGNPQNYEYTITVNIVYLQGPTVTGGVKIKNCALPGELIGFSTDGLEIKTPELMPVTAASWKILPLKEIDEHGEWKWDMDHGIVIPDSRYNEDPETQHVEGTIPAYYKQNEYTIAYIFTAGGYDFPVMPAQHVLYATATEYNSAKGTSLTSEEFRALPENQKIKSTPAKENRMIVVHNYHRMKDVVPQDLQVETMPSTIPDHQTGTYHTKFAEAKLYIEDEADLRAFVNFLNMATEDNAQNIPVGLTGLDIILQKDITLTQALPAISQEFAGTFHGDGYHIDLNGNGDTFLGSSLTGNVYNLGLVGGSIATTGTSTNCFEYTSSDAFTYGQMAYDLSHHFAPVADGYVEQRYANGDYQYATTDRVWSLRTAAPNYGHEETRHDKAHTHDANRWSETDGVNIPLHDGTQIIADRTIDISGTGTEFFTYRGLPQNYANDYLFFGQHLDRDNADAYPVHIEPIANGDPNYTKGGNRVYKTSGFYGSAVDNSFYYNKDAWALQPTLTAIDFTHRTSEGDNANTMPTKFSVDSNADYFTDDKYDNSSYGHVTQNLLVYCNGEDVFDAGNYANNTSENKIRYHRLKDSYVGGTFGTDYFHLVDKQDYNAPRAFNIKTRAWYERKPHIYRNADHYDEATAWEGLCLPFQYITTVMGEEDGNILSHFYGMPTPEMLANPAINDRTLHHEYWLTGMVASEGDKVSFTRPDIPEYGDPSLFQGGSWAVWAWGAGYPYENTYYRTLNNYSNHIDSRNEESSWYETTHNFQQYPYISQNIPYLIAFPGEDFYEFDLTDQIITFETKPESHMPMSVTDNDDMPRTTTVGSRQHVGTYMHVDADAQHLGINAAGSAFDVAAGHILPFRTYMTSTSAPSRSYVICAGKDGDVPTPNIPIDTEEETEPVPFVPTITITLNGTEVTVNSTYEENMPVKVYTVAGQYITTHTATPGISKFKLPQPGFYIINKKKVSTAR